MSAFRSFDRRMELLGCPLTHRGEIACGRVADCDSRLSGAVSAAAVGLAPWAITCGNAMGHGRGDRSSWHDTSVLPAGRS